MKPEQTIKRTLEANQSANYVWQNLQNNEKTIFILIEGQKEEYSID
jgi:hypothetical protein